MAPGRRNRRPVQLYLALLVLALLEGYWLLPISGQVIVITGDESPALLWPQIRIDPDSPGSGKNLSIQVTDVAPWANVLVTVDGQPADMVDWSHNPGGTWTWKWTIAPTKSPTASQAHDAAITFYHDCDTGCVERGRLAIGGGDRAQAVSPPPSVATVPTKLGVVFADPDRDWLDIVNAYQTTRGLPVYITSANTFAPDEGTPPAQNYPRGWLTTALQVVDEEPQILALAWFEDGPLGDSQWDWFSLSRRSGRMIDAAEELDALLRRGR